MKSESPAAPPRSGASPTPAIRPLTVLLVHDRYLESGGEDAVFDAEGRLLEGLGHTVVRYEVHNRRTTEMSALRLGARTVWSREARREVGALAREVGADVAHVHNTFPLLSPSIYSALSASGAAVVQTLHNYRLLCPQGMLLRDGVPCEICVGKTVPWPGVRHRCYRGSAGATAAIGAMLTVHRAIGTWARHIHAFVALSDFARDRFVAGGLPAERMHVKPNFVDPDPGPARDPKGPFLCVGRLSQEKGVRTLLEAWRIVTARRAAASREEAPELIIVGDGPLASEVAAAAEALPGLRWEGRLPHDVVLERMAQARALVFPTSCYEGCPLTVLEALARGLPVIGSRIGGTIELVERARAGRLAAAGDPEDLARALEWAAGAGGEMEDMAGNARRSFEQSFTPAASARGLGEIYAEARRRRGAA